MLPTKEEMIAEMKKQSKEGREMTSEIHEVFGVYANALTTLDFEQLTKCMMKLEAARIFLQLFLKNACVMGFKLTGVLPDEEE